MHRHISRFKAFFSALVIIILVGFIGPNQVAGKPGKVCKEGICVVAKLTPTEKRRRAGLAGEDATKKLLKNDSLFLYKYIDLHKRSVFSKGIDSLWKNARRNSYVVAESKAVSTRGRITLSILPKRKIGKQMYNDWVDKNLGYVKKKAEKMIKSSDIEESKAGKVLLKHVNAIPEAEGKRSVERVLVIRRQKGIADINDKNRVSKELCNAVDEVIEIDATTDKKHFPCR